MSETLYQQGFKEGFDKGRTQGLVDAQFMRLWFVRNGPGVAIVRAINEDAAREMAATRDIRRDKEEFWRQAKVTEITQSGETMVLLLK